MSASVKPKSDTTEVDYSEFKGTFDHENLSKLKEQAEKARSLVFSEMFGAKKGPSPS